MALPCDFKTKWQHVVADMMLRAAARVGVDRPWLFHVYLLTGAVHCSHQGVCQLLTYMYYKRWENLWGVLVTRRVQQFTFGFTNHSLQGTNSRKGGQSD